MTTRNVNKTNTKEVNALPGFFSFLLFLSTHEISYSAPGSGHIPHTAHASVPRFFFSKGYIASHDKQPSTHLGTTQRNNDAPHPLPMHTASGGWLRAIGCIHVSRFRQGHQPGHLCGVLECHGRLCSKTASCALQSHGDSHRCWSERRQGRLQRLVRPSQGPRTLMFSSTNVAHAADLEAGKFLTHQSTYACRRCCRSRTTDSVMDPNLRRHIGTDHTHDKRKQQHIQFLRP